LVKAGFTARLQRHDMPLEDGHRSLAENDVPPHLLSSSGVRLSSSSAPVGFGGIRNGSVPLWCRGGRDRRVMEARHAPNCDGSGYGWSDRGGDDSDPRTGSRRLVEASRVARERVAGTRLATGGMASQLVASAPLLATHLLQLWLLLAARVCAVRLRRIRRRSVAPHLNKLATALALLRCCRRQPSARTYIVTTAARLQVSPSASCYPTPHISSAIASSSSWVTDRAAFVLLLHSSPLAPSGDIVSAS